MRKLSGARNASRHWLQTAVASGTKSTPFPVNKALVRQSKSKVFSSVPSASSVVKKRIMDLAQKLLSRRSDVEAIVSENKIVEDVLSGRSAIISRTSRKNSGAGISPALELPFGIDSSPDFAPVTGGPALQVLESRYIPKHAMESFDEYSKRLEMTPFFAETPGILQSRQGALFRKPPDVNAPPELSEFMKRATVNGMSWLDVVVKLSEQCQVGGFAGLLVDREILPSDVRDRAVTQAEVSARGLGRVIVAPFSAHQIRDWASDRHGLVWVKLVSSTKTTTPTGMEKSATSTPCASSIASTLPSGISKRRRPAIFTSPIRLSFRTASPTHQAGRSSRSASSIRSPRATASAAQIYARAPMPTSRRRACFPICSGSCI